jgi:DNA polymerase III subunit epsilon
MSRLPPWTAPPVRPGPGYAVLDFETTGPLPARDRAVEVAVVCCDPSGAVVGEWSTLLHPGQPSTGPTHLHGITAEDVAHAPAFADVAADLGHLLTGRVVVAHSAAFDVHVLRAEFARAGVLLPALTSLCTLEASRTHLPALRRRRLVDCCAATGVVLTDAHSALGDARATAGLLRAYLRLATERDRSALDDLVARAAADPWPALPAPQGPPAAPVLRGHQPVRPAGPERLAALLAALPSTAGSVPAPSAQPYARLLAEELAGGTLSDDGATRLADLARAGGLTRAGVLGAHREALRAGAARAAGDGPRRAAQAVGALAAVLGLGRGEAAAALEAARAERRSRATERLAPLPAHWPHGEPLRLGDRVAFTGCDDVQRRLLERRTRDAGLAVAGAVSRTTALLVTDDPASGTQKARAARSLGTRVVGPALYAVLLDHVQPAADALAATGSDASR